MSLIVLGGSVGSAIATIFLVLMTPAPYEVATALCGGGASALLVAMAISIDE